MREVLDGGRIKGGMLRSHLQFATERFGADALERMRAKVSSDTGKTLASAILPSVWYPFRALIEVDRAIAAIAGGDERSLIVDLGRWSARLNLGGAYKAFNKSQPHEFFQNSARLHEQFQDFGRAEYLSMAPTACRMSMLDYRCYSKFYCWSAVGFFEQATNLEGGRDAKVVESECVCEGGAACRFDIRWS